MFPKEFSIVLFLGLVIIGIYLLMVGKLNQYALSGFILVSFFIAVGFYHIENISKIKAVSKYIEILVDIEKVQKDIYAKSEEVKNMGEQIAEVGAFTIANQGRWVSDDHLVKMIENRNKIADMLRRIGTNDKDIERILEDPDKMACWDLWENNATETDQGFYARLEKKEMSNEELNDIRKVTDELRQMFRNNMTEDILNKYLKDSGLKPEIQDKISQGIRKSYMKCDYYKNNHKLMN